MEAKNFQIMVVDDIVENLQVLGNILHQKGFNTSFAQNGREALDIIAELLPDLILLDVSMPEIDGFEVCKILKENTETQNIPIIFLTALNELDDIVQGFSLGASDYVTKPFNPKELLARVNAHLELKQKREEIVKLNLELSIKNQNITDSIEYAKRIQQAMLPSNQLLESAIGDNFIFYKPKDIVSGDFYWFEKIEDTLYIVAADCTGHGVPGAFMSILGISQLNHIFGNLKSSKQALCPAKILDELRALIIYRLNQNNETGETLDGLDISLIAIDFGKKTMQFAGAHQPIWLFRKEKQQQLGATYNLIVHNADKMPIGIYDRTQNFQNHFINLQNEDAVYLFSDGYSSQLGSKKEVKFGRKRFEELLRNIQKMPMKEQQLILNEELLSWKEEEPQTDDILIIGLKFKFIDVMNWIQ